MNNALKIKTEKEYKKEKRTQFIAEMLGWLVIIPVTAMTALFVFTVTVAILIN
jgi:hypothetical protein